MNIPFVDLKTQYQSIKTEILPALESVLDSTQFVLGKEVKAFEEEFAAYTHSRTAIAVNSGTSALHLALLAVNIGPGDEVITTPFTFVATIAAIRYTGAVPVFVDINPESYTIDPALIEAAITPKTRAIMPVHLYGQMADMDPILVIAKRHNLLVIEDAAQAHGASYKGHPAGSMGDIGCFSFYPGKNLGAYGEGGAITTDSAEFERTIRILRDWGQEKKYEHILKGYNYRMDGFQGAVLRVKLRHLEDWTEARRKNAKQYDQLLSEAGLDSPKVLPDYRHVYHVYPVLVDEREKVQTYLSDHGVSSGIHYPIPIHLLVAHQDLGHKAGDFPIAERVASQELSLPMYAELTTEMIEYVVSILADAVK
ncbi:MAG: DegT/DnrJ/EryC1/StrS family aminotransferase [Anaerolineales bacterium]|nr:DegT/DnrJ/EryC1/StrS family aminotransferase [Anaerolineales bacterium]